LHSTLTRRTLRAAIAAAAATLALCFGLSQIVVSLFQTVAKPAPRPLPVERSSERDAPIEPANDAPGSVEGFVRSREGHLPPSRPEDEAPCEATKAGAESGTPSGDAVRDAYLELGGLDDAIRNESPSADATYAWHLRKGRFCPRVLVVPPGATVTMFNDDRAFYYLRLRDVRDPDQPHFYIVQYGFPALSPPYRARHLAGERDGSMRVLMAVGSVDDDSMRGYVIVSNRPHHAVSDERGSFRWDDVVSGDHELVAWHETLGVARYAVHVKPREKTTLIVTLP
jgi:hypothetical protein